MALLEVRGLVKRFGSRTVVNGVSFEVSPGEVVGLLGPNGAGKTTSFRMATGQITPNEGTVLFANEDVTTLPMYRRARLGMGYLSQEPSVFRKLTVEQNLMAILEALPRSRTLGRKLTRSERWDRTEAALNRFNLLEVRKNVAARCSGGEKRRLEIARALVCEPLLILLDEPLAAVDPLTKEDIRKNIRELANAGIGILLTDHDVREVMKIADRAYLIIGGKVVAHGTPSELKRNKIAIDGYLGSTFEDEWQREATERKLAEMHRLNLASLGQQAASDVATITPATLTPPAPPPATMVPSVIFDPYLPDNSPQKPDDDPPPSGPNGGLSSSKSNAPSVSAPPVVARTSSPAMTIRDELPNSEPSTEEPIAEPTTPRPVPVMPSTPIFGPSGPGQFSTTAQQLLEQEKLRRLVEMLATDSWQNAWHELATRGTVVVPVLLEALERKNVNIRHLAFRLLEQITGETLTFQADAADEVRLRQIAYLRSKLEPRRAA